MTDEEFVDWRSKIMTSGLSEDIVMPDADAVETESTQEHNFLIGKIKHTVKKTRKNPAAR